MQRWKLSLASTLLVSSGFLHSTSVAAAPTVGTCMVSSTCSTILGINATPTPARTTSGDPVDARQAFIGGLDSFSSDGLKSSFETDSRAVSFNILSNAARLTGVANSTESNARPVNLLTNVACLNEVCPGRFDTTGDTGAWWESATSFTVDFLQGGVSAFGFYATDVGDFDGSLSLTLTHSGGTTDVAVTNADTIGGAPNGSLLFFGISDPSRLFTSIRFNLTQRTGAAPANFDYMGIDDIVGGQAKRSSNVPEPATLVLVLASLSALCAIRRRPR
jgi:hypothetical protein